MNEHLGVMSLRVIRTDPWYRYYSPFHELLSWGLSFQAVAHTYAGVPIQGMPVYLSPQYVAENREVVKTQLMRAGTRLSVLLNKAFQ